METKKAAINVWKAFASRDAQTIRSVLSHDVEWLAPVDNATATALGVTHHMIGPDAIISFILNDFRRLFSNGMKIEVISITAEGNRVVFEQRQQAVLANGNAFDLAYVFIFEMEGGAVRRIREYMDTRKGHRMVFGDGSPRRIL